MRRKMIEQHTVEVTFEGELVATFAGKTSTDRLYKTPDGDYLVHIDSRSAGGEAVLETGHYPHGLSERDVEVSFPYLFGK